MQDDMYFTSYDAIREVRQFEVIQREKVELSLKNTKTTFNEEVFTPTGTVAEDYYDYSYTARIRRFNNKDNSWAYYDPYFTNYYWFNNAKSQYFGNSVYTTYSWWGNNMGANYNSNFGEADYSHLSTPGNWTNPWKNSWSTGGWLNPNNQYLYNGWNQPNHSSVSWNNNFSYNSMYYNSKDNNCYWWWSKDGDAPGLLKKGNFIALMQKNGIKDDVIKRPDINYTQIKTDYAQSLAVVNTQDTSNTTDNSTDNSSLATKNSNVRNLSINKNSNNSTTNTSNTSKRWDNYKTDVNISPNNNSNNNWSRSGVFSEGSRNNNYEFKGTVIQKKKENDPQEGTNTLEKAPKK